MPYIGYFSLIKHTDEFILFDTVQFIRHGWIERNRILKQTGGWQYVQVPIIKKDGRDTKILDVKIDNSINWQEKMLAQMQHYKKRAPYFYKVRRLTEMLFSEDYDNIVELDRRALLLICEYLDIQTPITVFSQMNLPIEPVHAPDEWALNICKARKANTYINPIGGMDFFDRTKYENAGVKLYFMQTCERGYKQFNNESYENSLSILDVLMFNSIETIHKMLDDYKLL